MTDLARRGFLFGAAASLVAAPAIVRAGSLMPVRGIVMDDGWVRIHWAVIDRMLREDARRFYDTQQFINFRQVLVDVAGTVGVLEPPRMLVA